MLYNNINYVGTYIQGDKTGLKLVQKPYINPIYILGIIFIYIYILFI